RWGSMFRRSGRTFFGIRRRSRGLRGEQCCAGLELAFVHDAKRTGVRVASGRGHLRRARCDGKTARCALARPLYSLRTSALPRAPVPFTACLTLSLLFFASKAAADEGGTLEWSREWPRFRPAEVALTVGLGVDAAATVLVFGHPQRNWQGGILFDDAVRDG